MTDRPGAGQTMFELVRYWSRRGTGDGELARRGRDVQVTEAVRALADRPPVGVNEVAVELGLDQSGASRMIKDATAAGYLAPARSAADGRRRTITVTTAGEALLAAAHRWQEEVFAELTEDWTPRQRQDLRRSLRRLLDQARRTGS